MAEHARTSTPILERLAGDPDESVRGAVAGHPIPGTAALASGKNDVTALLTNLADTTHLLAADRVQAVTALQQLSRLAHVQNEVLDRYHNDMDRQIKQVDAILAVAATQTQQLGSVVDFLNQFTYALPKAIPLEFTQVYMWAIPCINDSRSPQNCLGAPG